MARAVSSITYSLNAYGALLSTKRFISKATRLSQRPRLNLRSSFHFYNMDLKDFGLEVVLNQHSHKLSGNKMEKNTPQKVIIVFDTSLTKSHLKHLDGITKSTELTLFPLTSNWRLIEEISVFLEQILPPRSNVHVAPAGDLIDCEVERIRSMIADWSTQLGCKKIHGKTIREWFALDHNISIWWFSLIAGKNTLKSKTFFQIAQLRALEFFVEGDAWDTCLIVLSDPVLENAIRSIAYRKGINHVLVFQCRNWLTKK